MIGVRVSARSAYLLSRAVFFTSPAREALTNLVKQKAFIEARGKLTFPGTNSEMPLTTEDFPALDVRSGWYQDLPILQEMVSRINTVPVLDAEHEERISKEIDECTAKRLGAFEGPYEPILETLLVSQQEEIEKGRKYILTARYVRACVRACVSVCVRARPRAYHSVWARPCERLLDLIQVVLIRRKELFELFNIPVPTLIFAIKAIEELGRAEALGQPINLGDDEDIELEMLLGDDEHTWLSETWLSETDEPETMEQDTKGHGSNYALPRFSQGDPMWCE